MPDPDLRPTGMTTISVIATPRGGTPLTSTSPISGARFAAGDLPIGNGIQLDVLLHDPSNRGVGVGNAVQLVDVAADKAAIVSIPVRRPFVYAATGTALSRRVVIGGGATRREELDLQPITRARWYQHWYVIAAAGVVAAGAAGASIYFATRNTTDHVPVTVLTN